VENRPTFVADMTKKSVAYISGPPCTRRSVYLHLFVCEPDLIMSRSLCWDVARNATY